MQEYLLYKVSRADLPDALRGERVERAIFNSDADLQKLAANQVAVGYWVDSSPSAKFPDFVIVPTGDKREFLAWLNTYIPDAAPISQWCRVFTPQEFERYRKSTGDQRRFSQTVSAWAAAVVGECIAQSPKSDSRASLNFVSCLATYSFAAARIACLWSDQYSWSEFIDRIETAHSFLRVPSRRIRPQQLMKVWRALQFIEAKTWSHIESHEDQLVLQCCIDLANHRELSVDTLKSLERVSPVYAGLPAIEHLEAEQRVLLLEAIAKDLPWDKTSEREKGVAEFVLGYVAAQVGGGWRNIELLYNFSHFAPLSPVWFAVVHAFREAEIFGSSFDGLSRLVLRELLAPFSELDRPHVDVSADELEVIAAGASSPTATIRFRTMNSRSLVVELFPGVPTQVGMDVRRDDQSQQAYRPTESQISEDERKAIYRSLGQLQEHIDLLKRELLSVRGRGELRDDTRDRRAPAARSGGKKKRSKNPEGGFL